MYMIFCPAQEVAGHAAIGALVIYACTPDLQRAVGIRSVWATIHSHGQPILNPKHPSQHSPQTEEQLCEFLCANDDIICMFKLTKMSQLVDTS